MPGSTRASGFTRVSATTSLHIPTGSRHGTRPATAPAVRPASALPKSKPVASAVSTERKGATGTKPARLGRVVEKTSGAEGVARDGARSRSAGAKKKVRRAAGAGALVEEQDGGATRPAVLTGTAPPAHCWLLSRVGCGVPPGFRSRLTELVSKERCAPGRCPDRAAPPHKSTLETISVSLRQSPVGKRNES